jgi:Undecaprenyl-phosphate glucose phosphotransferase
MSIAEPTPALAAAATATEAEALHAAGGRVTSRLVDASVVSRLQKLFDFCVVALAGAVSLPALQPTGEAFGLLRLAMLILFGGFCFTLAVRELGGYAPRRLLAPRAAGRGLAAAGLGAGLTTLAVGAAVGGFGIAAGAAWAAVWWGAAMLAMMAERLALAGPLRCWDAAGRLSKRVVIVGAGGEASLVAERLRRDRTGAIDLCGVFDDRGQAREPNAIIGCPNLGTIDDLVEFSRWFRVDAIIVALPLAAERRLLHLLKQLWVMPADIHISALGSALRLSRRTYSHLGEVPLIDAFDRPMSDWGRFVKYASDRVLAALLIALLSPVLLAVALAVKLDSPGPVLFRQPRYGFNNQLIEIYKFRSLDQRLADRHAERLVTPNDPRVTRVGRLIRRTSLDELPQLFNVLKGELSLVGPRPHAVRARAADQLYDEVVEGYFARHRVRPGVTGWAQINGWRGETDTAEKIERRVEHDMHYIENWSLLLDLEILVRTPFALLGAKGAF